jgi:transposase-like protein
MNRVRHEYSEALKRGIVEEIESGRLSIRDASDEVGAAVTQVQKWLEEYGRFKPKRDVVEVVMKSEKEKIAELEKALAEAHLKIRVYDELINQAKKKYKIDIKKNFGTQALEHYAEGEEEKRSEGSARYSARHETLTTSAKRGAGKKLGKRQS